MLYQRKDAEYKQRDFTFRVKAVDDTGRFSGYASVFGVLDSYREVVAAGAFEKSLGRITESGRPLPALWQHLSAQPVGGYDTLSEDESGLYVEGFLLTDAVERAREAHALMKANVVSGLSIGYYVLADSYNEKERVRTLTEVDLQEISIVTFPANGDARIDQVKSQVAHGRLPTIREFETLLRDAGFSRSQSAVIATRGLKHLIDSGEPSDLSAITATLKSLEIPSFK
jgi:HK97 family phage prohead protease